MKNAATTANTASNTPYYRAALTKKFIGKRLEVGRIRTRGVFFCQVTSTSHGIIRNESPIEQTAITTTINELDQLHMVKWGTLEIDP